MILRRIADVHGTERHVRAPTWSSHRLLVADDGLGFSVHHTVIRAGTTTEMHYRNHVEAVYCIAGVGTITDLATGDRHPIAPGTLYALDQHDPHVLEAIEDLHVVCVFDPPCIGSEQHDENGSYPAPSEAEGS